MPTISFAFCRIRAGGSGALDEVQAGVIDEGGALLMVAVCSETGYLMALPLKSKNQMNLITHELVAFTQVLGHGEVQYYADNEPTLRQILRLLVSARSTIGLKTTMRTTKIYDSAGNSLVETSIQRIRSLAAILMEDLAGHIEFRFNRRYPLWTWACRHSAWLFNKFQAGQGVTSHELLYGKVCDGKINPYGEVCLAYTKPRQGFKADPRWKIGIYLGKTELQDNWIIGDGNRVFLSRSLRRVENLQKEYISSLLPILHNIFLGIPTELWRMDSSFETACVHGWWPTEGADW